MHSSVFLVGTSLCCQVTKKQEPYIVTKQESCRSLEYFKEEGWNAIRVRLFVEPDRASAEHKGEGVCQDLDYVMKLGQRIKKAGYQFMLDFHYSDTWADPGKQFMPYRWKNSRVASLPDSVYQYTRKSLEVMVKAGGMPRLDTSGE